MSFGNQLQKIELSNLGLCMLTGLNNSTESSSSNGAGKSSLIEAIVYGIYGKRADGVRGNDLINRNSGKNLMVNLNFSNHGNYYQIYRYRKDSKYKNKTFLYRDSKNITGRSIKATNQEITRIFGMDFNTFLHSYLIGVGNQINFTSATDKEKKKIIEDLAHLSLYSKAQDFAKLSLKKIEGRIQIINSKTETQKYSVQSLIKLRAELLRQRAHQEKQSKAIQAKTKVLIEQLKEIPIQKYQAQFTILKKRIQDQHIKDQRHQIKLQEAQKKYFSIESKEKILKQKQSAIKKSSTKIKQTRLNLSRGRSPQKETQRSKTQIKRLRSEAQTINQKLKLISPKQNRKRLQELKLQIENQKNNEQNLFPDHADADIRRRRRKFP